MASFEISWWWVLRFWNHLFSRIADCQSLLSLFPIFKSMNLLLHILDPLIDFLALLHDYLWSKAHALSRFLQVLFFFTFLLILHFLYFLRPLHLPRTHVIHERLKGSLVRIWLFLAWRALSTRSKMAEIHIGTSVILCRWQHAFLEIIAEDRILCSISIQEIKASLRSRSVGFECWMKVFRIALVLFWDHLLLCFIYFLLLFG